MTMMTIVCPKCGGEGKLSLVEVDYVGPRRCWKCHELFTLTIINNQVRSCEPLSEEDYNRQQETKKAQDKMGGSRQAVKQEAAPRPGRQMPEPAPEGFRTFIPDNAPAEKPVSKTPPEKFRTFIPQEDFKETSGEEAEKKAPKAPPDRFRTFIPPAT
jgi:hypothetical protein